MKNITTHEEVIAMFEDATRSLHLHLERECGTNSVSFYISSEDEKLGGGTMDTETDEDGDYMNCEVANAIMDCYREFATVTEYDSLVAGTNPRKVHG
jgi:hypothetical protein